MSKVYSWAITAIGLMLLLQMAGLPTGFQYIMNWFGIGINGQSISLSLFALAVGAVLAAATTAGIAISFFTKTSPESAIVAPLTIGLLILVGTFASIINYSIANYPGWISYIVAFIFVPIIIGYYISLIEFWRGTG